MKILAKSALALAIAATTSMPTLAQMDDAPNVTGVTGRFRVAVICNDDSCAQRDFTSRFRMSAEEDLGNGSTVFGKYEFGVNAAEGRIETANARRLSYVGVKGGFGSISLGTRWSPYYNVVVSPADWTRAFGGTWNSPGTGYDSNFRVTNGVYYSIGGFQSMIQVASDDNNEDIDQIELAYSFSVGAASLGIAVNETETSDDTNIGISAAGYAGSVRLAASAYDKGDNGGVLAQVRAPMAGGTVSLSWGQNIRKDAPEASLVGLEYDKALGAHSSWFIGVEKNDDGDGSDSTIYGIGLNYDFQ